MKVYIQTRVGGGESIIHCQTQGLWIITIRIQLEKFTLRPYVYIFTPTNY